LVTRYNASIAVMMRRTAKGHSRRRRNADDRSASDSRDAVSGIGRGPCVLWPVEERPEVVEFAHAPSFGSDRDDGKSAHPTYSLLAAGHAFPLIDEFMRRRVNAGVKFCIALTPSSTGLPRGRLVGVQIVFSVLPLLRRERRLLKVTPKH
jgi:hypothetical protein